MSKSAVSAIMMSLLVLGTLALAFDVQPVKSDYVWTEPIYIRADGSIQPSTAPISSVNNVTYTLADNIAGNVTASSSAIIIQRDNIIIDGAGHTLQGTQALGSLGIELTIRSNVTIKNIKITAFYSGIYLASSSNNSVSGNNITNNGYGIALYSSNNNSVSGNNITASNIETGIYLYSSSNNSVSGNSFVNDGLEVYGSYGNVVTGNLVNGKPLVYLEEVSDYTVGDAGQVILVKCNNVTVENLNLSDTTIGVELFGTNNSAISGNNITNNGYGIYLYSSSNNNSLSGNSIVNNWDGILLYSSSDNSVSGNMITANSGYGIWLDSCSNNSIDENNITNNQYGISFASASSSNTIIENNLKSNAQYNLYLDNSSDNRFYLNSFVTSTGQIYMYLSVNSWDNGYPSGGNYWSTHVGAAIDLFRGVGQNESGIDGIGDAPYIFGSNETDHYPLMGPFGPSTMTGSNVTVFPASDVGLIFSNVTAAGDVVLNKTLSVLAPPLGNLTGEYYDVKVTASVSGNITIRIIYDASNMTLQQESNLQMMQYTPIPGDIRPLFGKVDMADIGYIARRFGTNSSSPLWDPAADITGPTYLVPDGKIDMRDIGLVAKNFGKTSQWVNITTYVDTTSHIIYGETTHFSLIGIH